MVDFYTISPSDFTSVPQSPSDQQIADEIRHALALNGTGAGTVRVTIDGTTTEFSWEQAQKQLQYWENRAAKAAGKKKMVNGINLRGA
jgi:hypothetical protein